MKICKNIRYYPFLWILLIALITIISFTRPVIADSTINLNNHEVDDQVTDIKIRDYKSNEIKDNYQNGDFVNIQVFFTGKVRAGDRLTINLPEKQKQYPYFVTFYGEHNLYFLDGMQHKTKVGNYRFENGKLTLTLDENAQKIKQVDGSLSFNAQIINPTNKASDLKLQVGTQIKRIDVVPDDIDITATEQLQINKKGYIQNDANNKLINWNLVINSNYLQLQQNITGIDILSQTQKIDPNSLKILIFDKNDQQVHEFSLNDFQKLYPDSEIKIADNKIDLEFEQNKFSGKKILINYTATLTTDEMTSFVSKTQIQSKINDKEQIELYQSEVPNLNFQIKLTKLIFEPKILLNKNNKLKMDLLENVKNKPNSELITINTAEAEQTKSQLAESNMLSPKSNTIKHTAKVTEPKFKLNKQTNEENEPEYRIGKSKTYLDEPHEGKHSKLPQAGAKNQSTYELIGLIVILTVTIFWLIKKLFKNYRV